jgi:hypothetical protein
MVKVLVKILDINQLELITLICKREDVWVGQPIHTLVTDHDGIERLTIGTVLFILR